jgi:hypothetical protein
MTSAVPNPGQEDKDADKVADVIDNCPTYNPDQKDEDKDGIGDVCDPYKAPIIPGQSPEVPKEPPKQIPIVPPKK